jgi:hypothetical protein
MPKLKLLCAPPLTSPHNNFNFGISVGAEYKFKTKR